MKCDDCGIREAEFRSLGGIKLCRICAYNAGLVCGEKNRIKEDGSDELHNWYTQVEQDEQ